MCSVCLVYDERNVLLMNHSCDRSDIRKHSVIGWRGKDNRFDLGMLFQCLFYIFWMDAALYPFFCYGRIEIFGL